MLDSEDPRYTKSFLGHLQDLRRTLLWSLLGLAVGMGVAAPLAPTVFGWIKTPVAKAGLDPDRFLRLLTGTGGLVLSMKIIFWTGILLAIPFVVVAVVFFVFPGLRKREQRVVLQAMGLAVVLFAAGVAVCYFLMLPMAIRVMLGINRWIGASCEFWETSDYVGFVLKLLLATGLSFEFPVVVLVLGRLGIVTSAQLRSGRRFAIVIIMAFAAFITPPDPGLTMMMLTVPMVGLYEMCIWIVRAWEKRTS